MEAEEILRPLLKKGDLKQTIELAEIEQIQLIDIEFDGVNIVTASILAQVTPLEKMDLIRNVGALFSADEYCDLLNKKIFTLHPQREEELKDEGISLTEENIRKYSDWYSVFSIGFPPLPLSILEDIATYIHDEKKLILDDDTVETLHSNYLLSRKYSEREIEMFFDAPLFSGE